MIDRVELSEPPIRLIGITQPGHRQYGPGGRMGVLTAIFTHTDGVALDIAGIVPGPVEWWREQLDNVDLIIDEVGRNRPHGLLRPFRLAILRQDAPGLRDRVDLALVALL